MANKKRLIDANAAIERAKESDKIVGSSIWETCEVVEFLEDCPIVDAVEVVHGRWEHDCVEGCNPFVDSLPIWVDVMQCSVCKEYIEGSHGTNYCPNCGAKMDLKGE